MLLRIFVPIFVVLFLNLLQFSFQSLPTAFQYDFQPPGFIPLNLRSKRFRRDYPIPSDESSKEFVDMWEATVPPENYTIEDDDKEITEHCGEKMQNSSTCKSLHTYYDMSIYTNNLEVFNATFVDIDPWINRSAVTGTTNPDQLVGSYRKAANVGLFFDFPFYGHKLSNITIATGGFVYVGDQTHSWLAATQYIAPLMANFDTTAPNSTIKYGRDGTKMIVEWTSVKLRDSNETPPFTFQMHLIKNGDIYFVYKDVPVSVSTIKDYNHPCKLGISDAYLFNHKVANVEPKNYVKRVIHEYHRISVLMDRITNNTVVHLKALPTCLAFETCGDCSKALLESFNCSWCQSKDDKTPFCSDEHGLNRNRQLWVEGDCGLKNKECENTKATSGGAKSTSQPSKSGSSSTAEPPHPEQVIPWSEDGKKGNLDKPQEQSSAGSGLTLLVMFLLVIICGTAWVVYAYYNPHTPSGQFLIKYRPSKWQIPSSHVRYSASLHM